MSALLAWWDGLDDRGRAGWTGVALCVALYFVHHVVWSPWLVEDAAISYSYARNAAHGEGWVTYPGGEWVEGFSNPAWTALLTSLTAVGISPWIAGKGLGMLLGAITLPLAWLWAREATRDDGLLPLTAPLWLAVSPQFAMFTASGLENALFCWLLALGSWWFLRELREDGVPWSALPMGLLAITRPEGPLYVAVMTGTGILLLLRDRPRSAWRPTVWAALCAAPWGLYEAYRIAVFAWPLPNTYYAKMIAAARDFQPWSWTGARLGWGYIRLWALMSAFGFLVPLFPASATGNAGWRGQLGKAAGATLALLLIPGAAWVVDSGWWPLAAEPEVLQHARIVLIWVCLWLVPWLGIARPGAHARVLAWMLVAAGTFYTLYAGEDWVDGFRWINHFSVPLAVLLADLAVAASTWVPRLAAPRARAVAFAAVAGVPAVAGVVQVGQMLGEGTEISPFDVGRRVEYLDQIQRRLFIDHATSADIDFGATMWWSGDHLVDVAGLTDVAVAHHRWEREFVREYMLRERRPELFHIHDHWMNMAGLGTQPIFNRDWVEVAPFVAGPRYLHIGTRVRRDLLFATSFNTGADHRSEFGGQVRLEGLWLPAPEVMPGGALYVELGWRTLVGRLAPFRAVLAISGSGRTWSWELPPARDWVMPESWRRGEVTLGQHALTIPDDMPAGTYDVAIVVFGDEGVLPADREGGAPVFARGELRLPEAVRIGPRADALTAARARLEDVRDAAEDGRCDAAIDAFRAARHHLPQDDPDQPWAARENHTTIARCLARRANDLPAAAAELSISQARRWDHRDPEVRRIGTALADTWEREGDEAFAADRPAEAYNAWRRTLAADPARPAVRKRAEEARDLRLGLGVAKKD